MAEWGWGWPEGKAGYTGVMHSEEKATGLHGKGNAGLNIPSKPQLNPASQGCTVTGWDSDHDPCWDHDVVYQTACDSEACGLIHAAWKSEKSWSALFTSTSKFKILALLNISSSSACVWALQGLSFSLTKVDIVGREYIQSFYLLLLTTELGDFLIIILTAVTCSVLSPVMKFLLHEWNLRLSPSQREKLKGSKSNSGAQASASSMAGEQVRSTLPLLLGQIIRVSRFNFIWKNLHKPTCFQPFEVFFHLGFQIDADRN